MSEIPSIEKLLELEAEIRSIAEQDPEEADRYGRELADLCREALVSRPEDPGPAAVWLRVLRRTALPFEETAPVVESLEAQFPDHRGVRAAATWLRIDEVRNRIAADDLAGAAGLLTCCLGGLEAQRDPSYLALSLLGAFRAFANALGDEGSVAFEEGIVALDEVLGGLEHHAKAWLAALPLQSPDAGRGGRNGSNRRGEPDRFGPRHRGFLLLRRLCLRGERWDLLRRVASLAEEMGVESEWLADAEVEAIARSGDPRGALAAVRQARKKFPRSEHLARHEARILGEMGQDAEAVDLLLEAAAAGHSPWPWRDLGDRILATGRIPRERGGDPSEEMSPVEWAIAAYEAGLSHQRPEEPGTVWRLHFELARLYFDLGDERKAGREAWLAREARVLAGWGVGRDIQSFLDAHLPSLLPEFERLDRMKPGKLRKGALADYRKTRRSLMARLARPAEVTSVRASFGFLKVEGIRDPVIFSRKVLGNRSVSQGDRILAVVVRSYDVRRQRDSHRAVWLSMDGGGKPKG